MKKFKLIIFLIFVSVFCLAPSSRIYNLPNGINSINLCISHFHSISSARPVWGSNDFKVEPSFDRQETSNDESALIIDMYTISLKNPSSFENDWGGFICKTGFDYSGREVSLPFIVYFEMQ